MKAAKLFNTQSLLWLALLLALSGSLVHLANTFASIDGKTALGWLQAIAIDAGVFALSYSLRARKAAKRNTKPLWFGIALFTGISIYGNLTYGLFAANGNLPQWIVVSRPYVLAATLPILVLYLAEILSDDRQAAIEVEAKEAAKVTRQTIKSPGNTEVLAIEPGNLAVINEQKQADKESRKAHLLTLHSQKPDASITELAAELGTSRATIRNYASELGLQLATATNGNGNNGVTK